MTYALRVLKHVQMTMTSGAFRPAATTRWPIAKGCPSHDRVKDPAAVVPGQRGGKAGTGAAKVRGDRAYYVAISKKAAKARAKKKRK